MSAHLSASTVCTPSDDVVSREIEGEIIIVPLVAGIGDADDELYTLNETGQAIWQRLDGQRTLGDVAADLAGEFDAGRTELEADVLGFAAAMVERGILSVKE
ncbi:MAG: PqqD family protein [Thermoleophilia bacterium]|nr:PqqD family protein [Thermoleophilia bacterium]